MHVSGKHLVYAAALSVLAGAVLWIAPIDDETIGPGDTSDASGAELAQAAGQAPVDNPVPAPALESDAVREAIIEFDNGRRVALTLRHEPILPKYARQIDRLADVYADMEAAALSGNVAASVQLYEELLDCADVPISQFELEQELAQLHEDGIVRDQHGGRMRLPTGVDPQVHEDYLRKYQAYCEGITTQQIENRVSWLRQAAEAGEYEGIRYLAAELGTSKESFDLLEQAWAQGHFAALAGLLHRHRIVNAAHPEGNPDYAKVYALQLILIKILDAADALGSRTPVLMRQEMNDALDEAAAFLSPHEQAMAEDRAADMLEANPNCCKSWWIWRR